MFVQGIQNKNNTNFRSRNEKIVDPLEAFVEMKDSELKQLAYLKNNDPHNNRKEKRASNRFFWTIPIVDTIASGVLVFKATNPTMLTEKGLIEPKQMRKLLANTSLSTRAYEAAKTGARWAGLLGLIGVYGLVKNSITSKSDHLKRFERTNPVSSFIVDIGILLGGVTILGSALSKGKKHGEHEEKILSKFAKLDQTKFAKNKMPKIQKSLENFIENSPKLSKAGRFALANSVWILFGAWMLNSLHNSIKKSKNIESDFHQIKDTQLKAAKVLAQKNELKAQILEEVEKTEIKVPEVKANTKIKKVKVIEIEVPEEID